MKKSHTKKSTVKTTAKEKTNKADEKDKTCIISGCTKKAEINEYCRLHYITHWNRIKKVERVEAERRLNHYIEEITRRYPTEYLEIIKRDLEDSKTLESVVKDMDLEEGIESDGDLVEEKDLQNFYEQIKPDDDY